MTMDQLKIYYLFTHLMVGIKTIVIESNHHHMLPSKYTPGSMRIKFCIYQRYKFLIRSKSTCISQEDLPNNSKWTDVNYLNEK